MVDGAKMLGNPKLHGDLMMASLTTSRWQMRAEAHRVEYHIQGFGVKLGFHFLRRLAFTRMLS